MHLNILLSAASLLICSVGMLFSPQLALACTRAVYQGEDKLVMTGRTMDWKEDLHSDLWIFREGWRVTAMLALILWNGYQSMAA